MQTIWYALLSLMFIVYIILDGFDFGAGIVYKFVAKTELERRQILSAIGPLWDGNEVWLIAAGGTLFFAFPKAYATGFSGFYMPLIILLWLLIIRGLSIELRSHEPFKPWHDFWDTMLQFSSILIAIVFGVAFGNIIRGVPLSNSGYFAIPLFTDMLPYPPIGVLDFYTLTAGIFCLSILALHGVVFLIWKTDGAVRERSMNIAGLLWWCVIVLEILLFGLTAYVRPNFWLAFVGKIWPLVIALLSLTGLLGVRYTLKKSYDLVPFLSSVFFILCLLASTAGSLFPVLITSTVDPSYSLSAYNASAGSKGLHVGLVWWPIGMAFVIVYFVFLYKGLSGKISQEKSNSVSYK